MIPYPCISADLGDGTRPFTLDLMEQIYRLQANLTILAAQAARSPMQRSVLTEQLINQLCIINLSMDVIAPRSRH
jgi:hypothetical protein